MRTNQKVTVFDGHNDTIKQMYLSGRSFFVRSDQGHVDLPKARQGGIIGGFFAMLVPAENLEERAFGYGLTIKGTGWEVAYPKQVEQGYAVQFIDELLRFVLTMERESQEIKVVHTFHELLQYIEQGILGIILHFEGAETIDEGLSNLDYYYEKGLRSLGLVWSRANAFGYGVPFKFPCDPNTGPGLTKAGKALVQQCNDLGIIIDLTHLNEKGFFDVAKISKAPLVVSHANVHSICPSTCNLINSQIDAVGNSGGVIGVNFDIINTRPDGQLIIDTPLSYIIQHIDYLVERIGINHVALGSDFDGAQMPKDLKNAEDLPKLIDALREHGYSNEDLEKITYKNWLRVIEETWE